MPCINLLTKQSKCHAHVHEISASGKGVARAYFFTEALAEFQHVNCMHDSMNNYGKSRELHAMLGLKLLTASVTSMVATPLPQGPRSHNSCAVGFNFCVTVKIRMNHLQDWFLFVVQLLLSCSSCGRGPLSVKKKCTKINPYNYFPCFDFTCCLSSKILAASLSIFA